MTSDKAAVKPVAWRLRIGDSYMWSYTDSEEDANFYGNNSGLPYVKEPLYTDHAAALQAREDDIAVLELTANEKRELAASWQRRCEAAERRVAELESILKRFEALWTVGEMKRVDLSEIFKDMRAALAPAKKVD